MNQQQQQDAFGEESEVDVVTRGPTATMMNFRSSIFFLNFPYQRAFSEKKKPMIHFFFVKTKKKFQ